MRNTNQLLLREHPELLLGSGKCAINLNQHAFVHWLGYEASITILEDFSGLQIQGFVTDLQID